MIILGIDPGNTGGIAIVEAKNNFLPRISMPPHSA